MKVTIDVKATPMQIAHELAEMSDDDMAQVFVEWSRLLESWPEHARAMQAHYVGRHLRDCDCSTPSARQFVEDIHFAMTQQPEPAKP